MAMARVHGHVRICLLMIGARLGAGGRLSAARLWGKTNMFSYHTYSTYVLGI